MIFNIEKHTRPRVSVIIPTYNRASLLSRSVSSVLSQTFTDYEIIIVNDCSSDYTQHVIDTFSDSRIRSLTHNSNKGISATRNTGIANAKGDYIAFLDDDDEMAPTRLEKSVKLLDSKSSEIGFVSCWTDIIDDSDHTKMKGSRFAKQGSIFVEALEFQHIPCSLVRSDTVRSVGGFDERMKYAEDSLFMIQIAQKYDSVCLAEIGIYIHRSHGGGRLTDPTPRQLFHRAFFCRMIILELDDEYNKRPKVYASALRRLSFYEMMSGQVLLSIKTFLSAIRLHPLNWINLKHALLLMKVFLWWATPLSHFRDRARSIRDRVLRR